MQEAGELFEIASVSADRERGFACLAEKGEVVFNTLFDGGLHGKRSAGGPDPLSDGRIHLHRDARTAFGVISLNRIRLISTLGAMA